MATQKSPTLLYDNDDSLKATAVTVTSAYGNKLQASNYGKNVTKIDASERTKKTNIIGNDKDNSIIGSSAVDTLDGGKGNDTLTGGDGADVFVYAANSGNDVITDYTAGQDSIKISSGSISGYSVSGDDLILNIGTGSLKIQGGSNDAITIKDSKNKISVYQGGVVYNNSKIDKATAMTITSNYDNESLVANSTMITLDASNNTNAIEIIGNKKNNKISGGAGNDVLNGGEGNDTLTGGNGADIFVYESGNDVIEDYTTDEDIIELSAGVEIASYSVSGKDLMIKTNSKGSIKVKNAKTQAVKISDGDNLTIYQNGLIYGGDDISNAESVSITSIYGKEFDTSNLSVTNIDASTKNAAIKITGNAVANNIFGTKKNDTIYGGAGDDTIYGSAGNDILNGGDGADVFIYADGDGKDSIADYGEGDVISLAGDYDVEYIYKTVKGGGGNSTLKIGKGSITIKDSANKSVTLIGANGEASIANNKSFFALADVPSQGGTIKETVYVTLPAETITVGGGDTVTVTVPGENETVTVTVPGDTVTFYGIGETVKGTSAAETLYGTAGNDTVTLGGGKDVYIYEGGFDVITDYTEGDDKISIGTESIGSGVVLGSDVLFAVGDGMLKLVGAKDKKVTLISGGKEIEYAAESISSTPVVPVVRTVTLESSYENYFKLAEYNSTLDASETVSNIDASAVLNSITIYGDDNANIIKSGREGSSIFGGEGNDTIYSGNGDDTIYYYEYGGQDTIYNYKTGDKIRLETENKEQFESFSLSGDDVIINLTQGGKITLKDAKDQEIYVFDRSDYPWDSYKVYNGTIDELLNSSNSSRVAEDFWFLEDDNNFVGGDIDSITEKKFAITQIQTTEIENIFAQDNSFTTYNYSEQK